VQRILSLRQFRNRLIYFSYFEGIYGSIEKPAKANNAFELNHSMGGFYGSAVWMDNCCEAINGEMRVGDTIIAKHGSALSLTVRYLLPRPAL
jgi:hypothetical protein